TLQTLLDSKATWDSFCGRLDPPRWRNGPQICTKENLPALPSKGALKAFLASNGTGCKVLRVWHCDFCGHFHAETKAPDPSGISSGSSRTQKHYAGTNA